MAPFSTLIYLKALRCASSVCNHLSTIVCSVHGLTRVSDCSPASSLCSRHVSTVACSSVPSYSDHWVFTCLQVFSSEFPMRRHDISARKVSPLAFTSHLSWPFWISLTWVFQGIISRQLLFIFKVCSVSGSLIQGFVHSFVSLIVHTFICIRPKSRLFLRGFGNNKRHITAVKYVAFEIFNWSHAARAVYDNGKVTYPSV